MTKDETRVIKNALDAIEEVKDKIGVVEAFKKAPLKRLYSAYGPLKYHLEQSAQQVAIIITEINPGKVAVQLAAGSQIDPDNSLALRVGQALYDECGAVVKFLGGEKATD